MSTCNEALSAPGSTLISFCFAGYSIFVVLGTFPDCEADQLLKLIPAVQTVKPKLISEASTSAASEDGKLLVEISEGVEFCVCFVKSLPFQRKDKFLCTICNKFEHYADNVVVIIAFFRGHNPP